jgi:hypothetical protein
VLQFSRPDAGADQVRSVSFQLCCIALDLLIPPLQRGVVAIAAPGPEGGCVAVPVSSVIVPFSGNLVMFGSRVTAGGHYLSIAGRSLRSKRLWK